MADKSLGAKMKKLHIPDVDPRKSYPMDRPKMGVAVIVNNIHKEMPGSRADVEALEETYHELGFDVQTHKHCDARRMREIQNELLQNDMHESSNAFILTVICHGNEKGHLLDKDKRKAWVIEDLISSFSVVRTLRGRPKIIVIQACRGGLWSQGIEAEVPLDTLSEDDEVIEHVTLPDKSDLFVAYATVPGYRAHAGDETGSAFLQSFATYLERHHMKEDLDTIYSMVTQYMAARKQGESQMSQVCEKRSSLRFPLRFSQLASKAGIQRTKPSKPQQYVCFKGSRRVKMDLISTRDTGLQFWGRTRFTVMPTTGDVIIFGKTSDTSPAAFHIYNTTSTGYMQRTELKALCEHEEAVYLLPVKVNHRELLAVSCYDCRMIRLLDLETRTLTTAFHNPSYYPGYMCAGEGDVMYVVHSVKGFPVLELSTAQSPFTGPSNIIQSGMEWYRSLCYIPPPHRLIVFSSHSPGLIRAVHVDSSECVWEMRGEVDGVECRPHGLLFSPRHEVLLVADGGNCRVLVLHPGDGSHLQTIQFPQQLGVIVQLSFLQNQLVVHHHAERKEKVSYFSIN